MLGSAAVRGDGTLLYGVKTWLFTNRAGASRPPRRNDRNGRAVTV